MDVQRLAEIARAGSFLFGGLTALLAITSAVRLGKAYRRSRSRYESKPTTDDDAGPVLLPVDVGTLRIFRIDDEHNEQHATSSETMSAPVRLKGSKRPTSQKRLEKSYG